MTLNTWLDGAALILILIGAMPRWGHSRGWGYGPSGLIGGKCLRCLAPIIPAEPADDV